MNGYYIKHPERIQNLGKAADQSLREKMQETLSTITETRIRLSVIRGEIANAKEREAEYRARDTESRDSNRIPGRA